MRKATIILVSLYILMLTITGCAADNKQPDGGTPRAATQEKTQGAVDNTRNGGAAGGDKKTGLAVITSIGKSTDAGEKEGLAQVDSTVVAVTVDSAGKITDCKIDAVQTKINFTKDGKITTSLDDRIKSKQELGTDYGMGKASPIKKEWNEQANAFAEYVRGKTVDEIKSIAINEEGVPKVAELTSSVTIHVTDFIAGIEKAAKNAQ